MSILPKSIERLAQELANLPGIGPKTANRLTFYLLGRPVEELIQFGFALSELKANLTRCRRCQIVAETDPCNLCLDSRRDQRLMVVVEEPLDVLAMAKTGFSGIYHVLGGQISPINNVSAADLTVKELLSRLESEPVQEVVLATDPSLEGEATALYLNDAINQRQITGSIAPGLEISRLARGLPVGGDLEYADELTLTRALEGRQKIEPTKQLSKKTN